MMAQAQVWAVAAPVLGPVPALALALAPVSALASALVLALEHLDSLPDKLKCTLHKNQMGTVRYTLPKYHLDKVEEWVVELAQAVALELEKDHLGNSLDRQQCTPHTNQMDTDQCIWPKFPLDKAVDWGLESATVSELDHLGNLLGRKKCILHMNLMDTV